MFYAQRANYMMSTNLDPQALANLSESYVAELFLNSDSDFSKETNLLLFDMAQTYVIINIK